MLFPLAAESSDALCRIVFLLERLCGETISQRLSCMNYAIPNTAASSAGVFNFWVPAGDAAEKTE